MKQVTLHIGAVLVADMSNQNKAKGIRLAFERTDKASAKDFEICYLDDDEIDPLLDAIQTLQAGPKPKAPFANFLLSFKSRSGLAVEYTLTPPLPIIMAKRPPDGPASNAPLFLATDELPQIKKLILDAKEVLSKAP